MRLLNRKLEFSNNKKKRKKWNYQSDRNHKRSSIRRIKFKKWGKKPTKNNGRNKQRRVSKRRKRRRLKVIGENPSIQSSKTIMGKK